MEKTAIEYGDGLFELAFEEDLLNELLPEVRALRELLRSEPSYTALMTSKNVGKAEKDELLRQAFEGKVHRYLYNFIRLMNDRAYFAYIPSCMTRFEDRWFLYKGIKKVVVRSAVELNEEQKERIERSVEKKLGAKVEAVYITDPGLIAGLRIEADGILIENSARRRIDELKKHLSSAVTGNS